VIAFKHVLQAVVATGKATADLCLSS
jgi:hypothetical protein